MVLYQVYLVPTAEKILLTEQRYFSTLHFEMGSLLAACTLEHTHSAKIFRKGVVYLIPWRSARMHNQVKKASQYLHAVLFLLIVELDTPTATALCAASYTDNSLQRT